jgi:hypothetical protein
MSGIAALLLELGTTLWPDKACTLETERLAQLGSTFSPHRAEDARDAS